MCGILGFFNSTSRNNWQQALDTLRSRGPDESDHKEYPEALLAHTRLSVIDLKDGKQPMVSSNGRYAITYNGEIYNFLQLRKELINKGYHFQTNSDTEVILNGYLEWNVEILKHLDGMFSFAIWDNVKKSVFAARDKIGIKPLFYSNENGLIISSTLKPFLAIPDFPKQLNYEALRDYLAWQTIYPPHSFLKHVKQLPPACYLTYTSSTKHCQIKPYWDIPRSEPADRFNFNEVVDEVDNLLRKNIKNQLVADVPIGAFLSGGIDSSLMVHYMSEASTSPVQTFSMRFDKGHYDESKYAQSIADTYSTNHHIIDAPTIGPDNLLAAIKSLDQPLADPAYITTFELSRLTRQHVTVAISGDGGDELFGGYNRYLNTAATFPNNFTKKLLRFLISQNLVSGAALRRSLSGKEMLLYKTVELGPFQTSRKSMKSYLSNDAWEKCKPENTLIYWRNLVERYSGNYDTEGLMRADLWTYLSANCLVKTDRSSMAHSLEVRVPILGNDILEYALKLPTDIIFKNGNKSILKALAAKYLPEETWNRPKHGFSVPLATYLKEQWKELGQDYFSRSDQLAPFLNHSALNELWTNAIKGKASHRLTHTFLVLLIWLETNNIRT